MISNEKEVRFDLYCKTCAHYQEDESEDICNECLTRPVNENSVKPINWKKR